MNSKQVRPKKNRSIVRYLGFVVDPDISFPHFLTHALVNFQENPLIWYVVELSPNRYSKTGQDSVGRYFRTIFYLSVLAYSDFNAEKILKINRVLVPKNSPVVSSIGSYLREQDREDKTKSASASFGQIRRAIHGSFFTPSGEKKGGISVLWKGGRSPKRIFFWTPKEFKMSGFISEDKSPFRTVENRGLVPETFDLHLETLVALSRRLHSHQFGNTWQELYRKALIKGMYSQEFIPLYAESRDGMGNATTEWSTTITPSSTPSNRRINVMELLHIHSKILLTGPSGIGKSTILHHLAGALLTGEVKVGAKTFLPILIPLKLLSI